MRFRVLSDGAVMVTQNQPVGVDFMVFFGGFLWVFAVSRVISCLWRGVFGGNCGIFLGFWRVFVRIMTRGVFGCFGMWVNVSFALVSALCTLVQILVFGGQKSTSRGCFFGSV